VLFVAYEEGINETLADKVKRLDAVNDNLDFADTLPGDISTYKFIFIDSINRAKLSHQDIIALINKYPDKALILVSQVTKEGMYRGSTELEHDVDCIIRVDRQGNINSYGRFAQGGKGVVDYGNEPKSKSFQLEFEKN
jgi:predicted ATP-dependent serine protease